MVITLDTMHRSIGTHEAGLSDTVGKDSRGYDAGKKVNGRYLELMNWVWL